MRNTRRALADFAEGPQSTDSPLYGAMTRAIMKSETLMRMVEKTPENQPVPLHLLAALQYLIGRTPEHALTGFYVEPEHRGSLDELQEAMEQFATSHQDEIELLLATRTVQTNETGRAGALVPGFCLIYERTRLPLATIEIGAAAGLLLGWPDFFYDYGNAGQLGSSSSLVKLQTEVRGHRTLPLPSDLPPHAERIGIDRSPLDVSNPDDADWLRALVWPEHPGRLERLNFAIETVANDPPYILQADAPDGLDSLLMQIDGATTRVIFHSIALYQSDRETWTRIDEVLLAASRSRPVFRLGLEFDAGQKGIDQPFLTLSVYERGGISKEVLAQVQYHGRWIEWLVG
ncbi:MAG: DUF2332 domain-containing protein [Acidimicrobiia bacterium]|nr:DUF2332 domain-containing protein [Acidimicrobiia bacterium]